MTMTRKISLLKAFALALPVCAVLLAAAPAAHAQLTLTLTPASQAGNPGDMFDFTGTLSNPTANEVFLNGDSPTFNGPGIVDGSSFLNNAPFTLEPAGSTDGSGNPTDSYTGDLFNVTLDPTATPGTYYGTFAVTGGADGSAMDTVATQDFSVTVLPAAVPEASSVLSMGLLLALGGAGLWRAKRRQVVH